MFIKFLGFLHTKLNNGVRKKQNQIVYKKKFGECIPGSYFINKLKIEEKRIFLIMKRKIEKFHNHQQKNDENQFS